MLSAGDTPTTEDITPGLSPLVRMVLWDYERGSLAYDLAVVVVLLTMLLVPGAFWADPLWAAP